MKVIRFTATWCGPCRIYKPVFDEVQKQMSDSGVEFETIDIDWDDDNLAEKYGIKSIPTTVFLKENMETYATVVGPMKKSDLVDAVESLQ